MTEENESGVDATALFTTFKYAEKAALQDFGNQLWKFIKSQNYPVGVPGMYFATIHPYQLGIVLTEEMRSGVDRTCLQTKYRDVEFLNRKNGNEFNRSLDSLEDLAIGESVLGISRDVPPIFEAYDRFRSRLRDSI